MIVEDQHVTSSTLATALQKHGYEVVGICTTAEQAITTAKIETPDLVLMDISIDGDRDGVSAAFSIRSEIETAIVFLTSHADRSTVARATKIMPNGFVLKPFGSDDVIVAIEAALSNMQPKHAKIDPHPLVKSSKRVKGGLTPANINRVIDYIDRHLDQEIVISDLARIARLSENHFSAQFRRSVGRPPGKYIEERRIEESKRLLIETSQQISEIANVIGLGNASYFATVFKRNVGMTPTEFRSIRS